MGAFSAGVRTAVNPSQSVMTQSMVSEKGMLVGRVPCAGRRFLIFVAIINHLRQSFHLTARSGLPHDALHNVPARSLVPVPFAPGVVVVSPARLLPKQPPQHYRGWRAV